MRIFIILMSFFIGFAAFSKDLTHRLGVGYRNNTALDLSAITANYNPTQELTIVGGFGIDTEKNYSKSLVQGGIKYLIYPETNMNFYSSAFLSLINSENPTDGKKSGIELSGNCGVEFFFTGLENLGLNFETGIALSTLYNSRIRTVGNDPLRAGMTFYF